MREGRSQVPDLQEQWMPVPPETRKKELGRRGTRAPFFLQPSGSRALRRQAVLGLTGARQQGVTLVFEQPWVGEAASLLLCRSH